VLLSGAAFFYLFHLLQDFDRLAVQKVKDNPERAGDAWSLAGTACHWFGTRGAFLCLKKMLSSVRAVQYM
jgi:hypothetical protein